VANIYELLDNAQHSKSSGAKVAQKILMKLTPGADAINISGLLVKESRLLNPKKLGNFKN